LIDAYGQTSVDLPQGGSPHWNSLITPQLNVGDYYQPDNDLHEKLRSQGVTARLVASDSGIIKGTSSVVLTGESESRAAIVASHVAQHVRLTAPGGRGRDSYPNSPMGAVALARQTFYDAEWYRRVWSAHEGDPTVPRPARNDALVALRSASEGGGLFIFDAMNELYFLRADRVAREFGLRAVMLGSGHEYKRIEAIKQTGRSVILPLDFPKPPNVATAEAVLNVGLDRLMHWDIAPENPGRLDKAGIKIALTSHGLADQKNFLDAVRTAIERGLGPDAALRALTIAPAEILGVSDRLGTVARGKLANLIVTDGPLFEKKTKLHAVWVQGKRFELITEPRLDVRGTWRVEVTGADGKPQAIVVQLTGDKASSLGGSHRPEAGKHAKSETKLIKPSLHDAQFQTSFDAGKLGHKGRAQMTAIVSMPEAETPAWIGFVVWPNGQREPLTAERISTREEDAAKKDADKKDAAKKEQSNKDPSKKDESSKDGGGTSEQQPAEKPDLTASFAVNFPLGAYGRDGLPALPSSVLFENATIWTCDAAGILQNASVLISNGKIVAVGQNLAVPTDTLVVDCRGKHISPGIIDCHSHMATDGGVNESAQAITAEVRIGDFIDADDINIYRQLAGGVTSSNILHGSANPIGGQNQVIKLRWGALPEAMKFAEAPAGIKFALGENVKQSNWGDEYTTRYPQTRMGVEQIMRDEFEAARTYHQRWQDWNENHQGLPPRRDLELEAVAEIVNGQRWIHCHSYRQDEILALIRTLDDFGIQIGTFQHILEGYKVADAMAKHGAMGSSFSDWWAYKFEVYDAIPYNGALMHNAGVVVSFNSDDRELARHLNHEAAKAVKYGGVPPAEALKFVTLNPAKQLRIDQHTGSLKVGKHADLVVWSGSPLSNFSRCEQTWIDGRKYFDLEDDAQSRQQSRQMHATLVQKVLQSGEKMEADGEGKTAEEDRWDRDDAFCHHHEHPFDLHDDHHRHKHDEKK
jgi:N-acetylglucosamine-6-phosphate deacetylase